MSLVTRNIIANYLGSIWIVLMGLVFVPLYVKFLGIESYGLIGFFGTLMSLFSVLDMGLNATLNREMARCTGVTGREQASRDLLRTLETIYWIVAVIIGAIVASLSYPIAKYWVNPVNLSILDVRQAVMIMGLVIVLRWPFGLYQGGLMGCQKQVTVNGINAFFATARGFGAVLVLWLVQPTIQVFFLWQIIVSGLETLTSAFFMWKSLPQSAIRSRFRKSTLVEIWGFASGMMAINLSGMLLTQADKIILIKMLPLEQYGYYMLAWTLSGALYKIVYPISGALFPHFSQLVATGDTKRLVQLYHKSCQFMSVIVFPVALTLGFFSYQVLLIWTGEPNIAARTQFTVSLLVVAGIGNAAINIPYVVQLAYGRTSLIFCVNLVSVILLIPMLIFLTNIYGMVAGAIVWAVFNIGYVLIVVRIMNRRILKGELWRWYADDVGWPLIVAGSITAIFRFLFPVTTETLWGLIYLGTAGSTALVGAAMTTPATRNWIWNKIPLSRVVHASNS